MIQGSIIKQLTLSVRIARAKYLIRLLSMRFDRSFISVGV